MSAKKRKHKSAKERKRAQKSAKERFRIKLANNQVWNSQVGAFGEIGKEACDGNALDAVAKRGQNGGRSTVHNACSSSLLFSVVKISKKAESQNRAQEIVANQVSEENKEHPKTQHTRKRM